jgi:ABC-type sugar transport system permease subunit
VVIGSVWTFNMFNIIYLVSGGGARTARPTSSSPRPTAGRSSVGDRYGYAAAYAVLIFGVLLGYGALGTASSVSEGDLMKRHPADGLCPGAPRHASSLVLVTCAALYPVLWVLKMAFSPGQSFSAWGISSRSPPITLDNFRGRDRHQSDAQGSGCSVASS